MAALISATRTIKGGDGLRDKYNFIYLRNGSGLKTINWRCSNQKCKATLITRISIIYLLLDNVYRHSIQSNVI